MATWNQEPKLTDTKTARALLDCPTPELQETIFLVICEPLGLWYFVTAAQVA